MAGDDITAFTKLTSRFKVLPKDEEKRLIALAQEDPPNVEAWDKLVRHNIALVIHIAKKYQNQGLPFEDLLQEGLIGLLTAIHKFDLKRGALSTYATWWIRQAITRAIDNNSRAIRIPIHKLNEYRVIRRVYREFVERWGCAPDSEELTLLVMKAAEIDPKKRLKSMTKDEIEFLGRILRPHSSLDATQSEDENLTIMDYLSAAPDQQPEALAEVDHNKRNLMKYLDKLPDEERVFIMLKFGLMDGKERDRKEMAAYRRMSEADAQKKVEAILFKLRLMMEREQFNLE